VEHFSILSGTLGQFFRKLPGADSACALSGCHGRSRNGYRRPFPTTVVDSNWRGFESTRIKTRLLRHQGWALPVCPPRL